MSDRLELAAIIEKLNINYGYEDNRSSEFDFIRDEFELNLIKSRLKDFESMINRGVYITSQDVRSLYHSFQVLEKKGILSIEDLYNFIPFLTSVESFCTVLKDVEEYEVRELALDLVSQKSILERIKITILPDFTVSSAASTKLASIRRSISSLEKRLEGAALEAKKQYSSYLADDVISFKNGFQTISVKSSYKGSVDGVVAASSSSGGTAFMVPRQVLAVSNELQEMREAEKEEILRIIKELCGRLSDSLDILRKNYRIALTVDRMYGRVMFGKSYNGTIAKIGDVMDIKGLGHPLIDESVLVRNSVSMGKNNPSILLISGPNAGGKTVFIKTIVLAALMNQAGLFVPAAIEATLPIFSNVYFVAGDNQSVLDNLSTFSSHVKELERAYQAMDNRSLIVVDEIGQGTSPLEGSALGYAFIEAAKRTKSFLILTSHYEDLKDHALTDDEVLSAAMVFDEEKLEPRFKISYNKAGKSFGLIVASKSGLDNSLVEDAKVFIERTREDPFRKNLDELNHRLELVKLDEEKLRSEIEEASRLKEKRQRAIESLERQEASIKKKIDDRVEEEVEKRLLEIDEIWNKKKPIKSFGEMSKAKGDLKKAVAEKTIEEKSARDFNVGDNVRILLSGQIGEVKGRKGSRYIVETEGFTFTLLGNQLEYIAKSKVVKKAPTHSIDRLLGTSKRVPLECNLIGMRVEEAMAKLRNYLYDCIMMHYHQARVIHGVGTGALQQATHQLLKSFKGVKSFRYGGEGEGGVGSTVVYFL